MQFIHSFRRFSAFYSWLMFFAYFIGLIIFPIMLLHATEEEKILTYDSLIHVNEDGSMVVTETIQVVSIGDQIKRGIYREFPTRYRDIHDNRYVVGFRVIEVLRDGKPEPYHLQDFSNGKRVYVGEENVFLDPGVYNYAITYQTDRQLGFFKDHDELYWNVTGNGWGFPIDRVTATVEFPPSVSDRITGMEGYTGVRGSKEKDLISSRDASSNPHFEATRSLNVGEGMTIVITWPKGLIPEPSGVEKTANFIKDNKDTVIGFIGFLILLIYYLIVWYKAGRDPKKGVIIPQFTPPDGLSPASLRYIKKMGYDHQVFTAAILDMAVKGYIKIVERKNIYTLIRLKDDDSSLFPEEKKIAKKLLPFGKEIKLENTNHEKIQGAIHAIKNLLELRFNRTYFYTNKGKFVPGVLLSVFVLIITALVGLNSASIGLLVWLALWSSGVVFLLGRVAVEWKNVITGGMSKSTSLTRAVFYTLFSIPFVAGELFGLIGLKETSSSIMILLLVAVVGINIIFYHLLKAPTLLGRKLLDKIDGFQMYLTVAEKERLKLFHPPEKTPELFERYLPYALALGVEQSWTNQFTNVLAAASEGKTQYSPTWYQGSSWNLFHLGSFTSSLGSSFSSAIASSSTAPGSSSGSGGGGSSGGGGGGGGGGGW